MDFISAVSEGPRAADGTWSFLQRGCAATQWVTLSIQVKGVLGGDTVGAAHAAAAWWQVILTDVGGAQEVGVVVFSCGGARGSRRRQRGLAASILKTSC